MEHHITDMHLPKPTRWGQTDWITILTPCMNKISLYFSASNLTWMWQHIFCSESGYRVWYKCFLYASQIRMFNREYFFPCFRALSLRLWILLRSTTTTSTSTPTCTWPVSTTDTGMYERLWGPGLRQLRSCRSEFKLLLHTSMLQSKVWDQWVSCRAMIKKNFQMEMQGHIFDGVDK